MNLRNKLIVLKSICQQRVSCLSSVDNDEMATFQKVNDWWDVNGSMAPLHAYNDLRIHFIRTTLVNQNKDSQLFMSKPFQSKQILDIGCGGGLLSERMGRLGGNVLGLDANQNSIHIA